MAQPVKLARKANNTRLMTPVNRHIAVKDLYFLRLIELSTPADTINAPPNPITSQGLNGVALKNPTNKAKIPSPVSKAPNLSTPDICAGGVKDKE
ncbi:MAG: hypothetical protein KAY96_06075 [Bacteroidia bacterium]|nr:hypothetical protein [Bacteroidia bacterium]